MLKAVRASCILNAHVDVVLPSTFSMEVLVTAFFEAFDLGAVGAKIAEFALVAHRISFEDEIRPVDGVLEELLDRVQWRVVEG